MRVALVVLAALVACGEARAPEPSETAAPMWSVAFDDEEVGSLSGVWGSGPDSVFIVGGSDRGAEIYHYDGDAWTATILAGTPLLIWAHGFAADDVYAVGLGGTMVHYDGRAWSTIATGTRVHLWGIFGFAPDDLFIVGGDPFAGEPLILHYDGAIFTPRVVPNPVGAHALFKIWGIDGEIFAVGQNGLILRLESGAFEPLSAGTLADQDFVSLWGTSADRIVAVGGRQNARLAHWNGQQWQTMAPDDLAGLNGIHMPHRDLAILGGAFGFAGRLDMPSGAIVREAAGLTSLDLHAVWGDGHGRHYAVGGTFALPHRGVALVRE